jgi:SNF2 family DNA or RNA helicase
MILSDPKDMGKSVTAIAYMSALYHQMMVAGPFLVIAPSDLIPQW